MATNLQPDPEPTPTLETQATDEIKDFVSKKKADIGKAFKPKSEGGQTEVEAAIEEFLRIILQDVAIITDDFAETVESAIAALDGKLEAQLNQIIHHKDFQELESTWRGLDWLVGNSETDAMLQIHVLNVSKEDLLADLKPCDRSPTKLVKNSVLYQKLVTQEYNMAGGVPYGCLVGNFYFDHKGEDNGRIDDMIILRGMAAIAAAAHAPFIAAAKPTLFTNMNDWAQLPAQKEKAETFLRPEYVEWNAFRDTPDAMYVGLAMPRFLGRKPWGNMTNFSFNEVVGAGDSSKYLWLNAAFAMARNIGRAFKYYGWCTQIVGRGGGGGVGGLPTPVFPTDEGEQKAKCPVEVEIPDPDELQLSRLGLMPLCPYKRKDFAVFFGAQSLYKPQKYADRDATASEELSARLPYMFAVCRLSHYLKAMSRDWVGRYVGGASGLQQKLSDWLKRYKCLSNHPSETEMTELPLADYEITVEENQSNPGFFSSKIRLKTHIKFEGIQAWFSLVTKLSKERQPG